MKDTNNKLDYNVWSCGEYNNNLDNFFPASDAKVIVNNEWSNIGESSLKITRTHPSYGTSLFTRISDLTGTNNITATVKIYSPNNRVRMEFYNGSTLSNVICPASPTVSTITLTATVDSNYVDLRLFLYAQEDYVFIDDINITY